MVVWQNTLRQVLVGSDRFNLFGGLEIQTQHRINPEVATATALQNELHRTSITYVEIDEENPKPNNR